ncbi:MAG: ATP-dependent 6-phosphofructokinase [Candidatus Abyssobacteria bacterium SURF_17]|uniref:ATP-dependent 6-phosphofructokinase n=1 Tax=Candidatus Abyssobacteria bacterium SURF_17 TaxID=2093361 RepID=A0A419EQQ2_9BACT|nr:MAG: ATP-dependent 6-phosphofructokinase [Candidatus Abyssubacteria bacterium SURF_17]
MAGNRKTIGILTGGGDCPGINAVIRAVAKAAMNDHNWRIVGFRDGYAGLVMRESVVLTNQSVSNILSVGGTILGTSNKADPLKWAEWLDGKLTFFDKSKDVLAYCDELELSALVCVGGDGTLSIANRLLDKGLPVVGIPKTIDNDLSGTDITFGHDSAVATAVDAIDKLHTTAQSHHRVMVVEVMGRYAGWLALCSGLAGGGDIILIPEIPYDIEKVCRTVVDRAGRGKLFSIVVVAEGAEPIGGEKVVQQMIADSPDPIRLGGIGKIVGNKIEQMTGVETRVTILGHVQRGGSPTAFDRILATKYGVGAVELIEKKQFGQMVCLRGNDIQSVPIAEAVGKLKLVPTDSELMATARSVGTEFGDS